MNRAFRFARTQPTFENWRRIVSNRVPRLLRRFLAICIVGCFLTMQVNYGFLRSPRGQKYWLKRARNGAGFEAADGAQTYLTPAPVARCAVPVDEFLEPGFAVVGIGLNIQGTLTPALSRRERETNPRLAPPY